MTAQKSKEVSNPDEAELKRQYMEKMNAKKEKFMPFVKFLKKQGLKFKYAKIGSNKVEYFRVDEFNSLIDEKKALIQKDRRLSNAIEQLPNQVFYLQRVRNHPKLKYPSTVDIAGDHGKFAAFKFDTSESKRVLMMFILTMVIMAVLFPLWPYALKYGLWIVSLYLLTVLLVIIGTRLVVYTLFAIFGYSIWIFPNLFGDYGIIESFKPFISVERWDLKIINIILRLVALSICCYYGYHIYTDHSFIFENINISKTAFDDVHDWGVSKLKGEAGNFSQRALTNIETILNQTEQVEQSNFTIPNNNQGREENPQQGSEGKQQQGSEQGQPSDFSEQINYDRAQRLKSQL